MTDTQDASITEDDGHTYKVVRFFESSGRRRVIKRGLTLALA